MKIAFDAGSRQLTIARPNDQRQNRALHGLTRSLLNNMVQGVQTYFEKRLEIQGVGYTATIAGKTLELAGRLREHGEDADSDGRGGRMSRTIRTSSRRAPTSNSSGNSPPKFAAFARRNRTRAKASAIRTKSSNARPARPSRAAAQADRRRAHLTNRRLMTNIESTLRI